VHPAHGSTVYRTEGVSPGFDQRRGSAIQRPRTRASGSGGGARRVVAARDGELAGAALTRTAVHQNLRERMQNVARLLAHATGVSGVDRASSAAGTGRGRRVRSSELVSAPKCTRRRLIERGIMLTCEGEAGELEGEGDATAEKLGNGGGSGRASVWSGRGSYRRRGQKSAQYKLGEPLANQKRMKEGRGVCPSPAATKTRRRRRTVAAAMENGGCSSVCACKRWAKGQAGAQAQP
jgi:hypothetical protein